MARGGHGRDGVAVFALGLHGTLDQEALEEQFFALRAAVFREAGGHMKSVMHKLSTRYGRSIRLRPQYVVWRSLSQAGALTA